MLSLCLRNKHFPIPQFFADSHAFLHEFQLVSGLIPSTNCKIEVFASFSSIVNVDSPPATKTKGRKPSKKLEEEKSYTVSYLVNSFGLSPEKALYASGRVRFRDSQRPSSVLALLERQGFTKTQIVNIVRRAPWILGVRNLSHLQLKFDFFKSVGMSKADLARIVCVNPTWLSRSLEKKLIPNYNFLKSLLTDEEVARALRKGSWFYLAGVDKDLALNLDILKDLNVPESNIRFLLMQYPEALRQNTVEFKEAVSRVLEIGFSPLNTTFLSALRAVSGNSNKRTWVKCYDAYSSWGWSKDDIYMAFKKHPNCMLMSQEKLSAAMNFFVNKMGWDARLVARSPTILLYNLENRIIPRCSVIQLLKSRSFITKEMKLTTLVTLREKSFLENFVLKYEKHLPGLHSFYQGKLGVKELFSL